MRVIDAVSRAADYALAAWAGILLLALVLATPRNQRKFIL